MQSLHIPPAQDYSPGEFCEMMTWRTLALTHLMIIMSRSHLPLMFVGMEHIMLSNYDMADESLNAADKMCDGDPLLYNERGVMAFNRDK